MFYRARPGAHAVVHLHSTHAAAVSCLADADPANALPPLTAYYAMRVGTLPLLPYHAPGDTALGPLAEEAARSHHAVLLANHGPVVAGATLEQAADAIEEVEETARLHFLLRGHRTRPLTPEQAAAIAPPIPLTAGRAAVAALLPTGCSPNPSRFTCLTQVTQICLPKSRNKCDPIERASPSWRR